MLLKVTGLKKYYKRQRAIFKTPAETIKAVDGVSFSVGENRILGIVGESGCGKTTLAKLLLNLIAPTAGEIAFGPQIRNLRKNVGIVFQDPFLSLDPRMRIKDTLLEPWIIHKIKNERSDLASLLRLVGLNPDLLNRYPAALSGGQRQRICIARALSLEPRLIVLDEPVSSLDLITQKQIIELLVSLKNKFDISYIFISHNISLLKRISNEIMVMLNGKIVERAEASEIFNQPKSEYTKKLLEAAR